MGKKDLPALSGFQLIRLLEFDGWTVKHKANHGWRLSKYIDGRTRVTVVKATKDSMPKKTLGQILSVKQTRIGRNGLFNLVKKYGLKDKEF